MGIAVFSFAGETMEEVVGLKLSVGGYTLAVAESCTGGLVAQRLTDVPGSSKYFIEGVVAYANDAKIRTFGVEPMLLMEHGAVSAAVAEAMAEGVRKRAQTDFGLSITGVAGPVEERMRSPLARFTLRSRASCKQNIANCTCLGIATHSLALPSKPRSIYYADD